MLADRTGRVTQAYGVLDPATGAAYRATFIVDPQGRIRYYLVHPHAVGRNITEIVRTLKGLQYAEATGEGVPAGWVPGMSGIKRNFAKIGQY